MNKILYKNPIVGIGSANAFPFIGPVDFLKNYSIMCIKKRKDIDLIRKDTSVFCLEEVCPGIVVPRANSKELLKIDASQEYISGFNNPSIFSRKVTPGIEKFASAQNLTVLGNARSVRDKYENKVFFRESLKASGIEPIPAETYEYRDITWELLKNIQKRIGKKIVLQVSELTYGGGVGTAFIENEADFGDFITRMERLKNAKVPRKVETVIVTPYVEGTPSSIIGCVTKYGVITGTVQTQLQDISEVFCPKKGSGVYCGHDWSYKRYPDNVVYEAKKIARLFGEHISKDGYRGIFGLDLIINEELEKVYPIECNPRYTDALPVFTQLAVKRGLPTFEYFHFLEHMGVSYKIDVEKISMDYFDNFQGSQMILMLREDTHTTNRGEIEAGIYKYFDGEVKYLRPSYKFSDLAGDNEFLLTDGVPYKNTQFKRHGRIMRAIFPVSVLAGKNILKPEIKGLINNIYKKLDCA